MHAFERSAVASGTRGLLAFLAVAILAACGREGAAHPQISRLPFIDLVSALPDGLDPAQPGGAGFASLETSLAGTLVRPLGAAPSSASLGAPTRAVGFLATSWSRAPGGDYRFALRPGVVSRFGHTLSGADVRFSFARELARSRAARELARAAGISLEEPVTVLAPLQVRINVTHPSALVLAVLGGFRFGVLDRRAVLAHASTADPGAHRWLSHQLAFYGAYELAGFAPGRELTLRANPRFWAPPTFREVVIEAVRSPLVRVADVGTAAASHTSDLDWGSFQTAAHTDGLRAQVLPSGTVNALVPNRRSAPMANALVRRALSLAVDRTAIARGPFRGFATPARHPQPDTTPLAPGVAAPSDRHDPAAARALLSRAGFRHGLTLTLGACAGRGEAGAAARAELALLARELRAVGLRVHVRDVGTAAELALLERRGALDAVLEDVTTPVDSLALEIALDDLPGSPENTEGYHSPALDALAGPLLAALPGRPAERALTRRALGILAATLPTIPLVEVPAQNVTRPEIHGYAAYATQATYYDRLSG